MARAGLTNRRPDRGLFRKRIYCELGILYAERRRADFGCDRGLPGAG